MTKIEKIISEYPETGLINPYINTKFMFCEEMLEFFNQYILEYRDTPDVSIANEFAKEFGILKEAARGIEWDYVVVNRARIYKRINNLIKESKSNEEIVEQIGIDFGINSINAEKYVWRARLDGLDNISACYVKKPNKRQQFLREKRKEMSKKNPMSMQMIDEIIHSDNEDM